jgi:two-component system sensor histidine kinase/response regulator
MSHYENRKILLIDDNESIHEDFKKILLPDQGADAALDLMRSAFLSGGESAAAESSAKASRYDLHSAFQGENGYHMLCEAFDGGEPFAMAFVDMRMPPGWDGVETIAKLWEKDPALQVVVCTAFSDYTWDETVEKLGESDKLLILKKPFDPIEISQLAAALTTKWNLARREREQLERIQVAEQEARAYASSLETVNRALMTSKAASDMALELRTEFLVQVSNEVNLRLNEVLGNVKLLSQESSNIESSDELETVLETSHRLLHTIDEVLDVTALERGQVTVETTTCSPRTLAEEVIAEFTELAASQGVALNLSVRPQVPEWIETGSGRLRQILQSLVENALLHSRSDAIDVSLKPGKTEDWHRPELVFEVADNGVGIAKERMGTIFEPFSREGDADTRSGFGFGLALARRLALLLDGDITVRSEEGQGTTFALLIGYGTSSTKSAA